MGARTYTLASACVQLRRAGPLAPGTLDAVPSDFMMRTLPDWLLVSTLPAQERRAVEHVQRQGMVPYLPQFIEQVPVRGVVVPKPRVLFPSYLFVKASLTLYHLLRSTRGVSRVVTQAGEPSGITDAGMVELRAREDADGFISLPEVATEPPISFTPGQRVLITEGPFVGLTGVCKGMTPMERVRVLMHMLGKSTMGEFSVQALKAA